VRAAFIVIRPLTALLFVAAMLLVAAPQPASAHGGHDSGSVTQSSDGIAIDGERGIVLPATHGWSQSCPGSPGNACCCGGLTVCPGGARIAVVNTGGWIVLVPPLARGWAGAFPAAEPLPLPPPRLVLPRAPPFFS
jgi:hypothetical protein